MRKLVVDIKTQQKQRNLFTSSYSLVANFFDKRDIFKHYSEPYPLEIAFESQTHHPNLYLVNCAAYCHLHFCSTTFCSRSDESEELVTES